MNLSVELNEKFFNFKSKGTNRVAFAEEITGIVNKYLPESVSYEVVNKALAYSDKNTKSFLKFLVIKLWREDPEKSERLVLYIEDKFPKFLDEVLN